jgi:hypothetical protein
VLSRRAAVAGAAMSVASTLLLDGCTLTVQAPKFTPAHTAAGAVPKSALEQITAQQVRDKVGGGNIVVTCPHDLTIKLGATEDCVMAQDSKQFPIKVTINKVRSADDASWEWEIGHQLTTS